ncbi:hypothetical protein EV646_101437 [Kribbella antiqua]|uniref:Uncharacterized protein n=1 Tax=Kribbella antiqua TaxID=2512217 RepID=A0A4R2J3K8_9ACTN|nr:hypothetical protein [Kribbella antiqua]TCO51446.1 hypothetical protein EV646_101437 [Kribbella antiqua]
MNLHDAKALTGPEWLQSAARIAWETRIMRRRVPIYKATIWALQQLNNLSRGPDRPSMKVTNWERMGPGGKTFWMPKLETMTGRTDDPITSARELRTRTTFASRLARVISADEWPQIIAEYQSRKQGNPPRFHYISHRPLNLASHELMDKAWASGELPTPEYRRWKEEVKLNDAPGLYSEFYTHGGSRTIPGGETNPAYRLARLLYDVAWRDKASMGNEVRVLRKARVLRAQQVVKFLRAEVSQVFKGAGTERPAAPKPGDVLTPEVIAAVYDFTNPPELRSAAARGETTPDRVHANAVDLATTVARALPPPRVKRDPEAAPPPAARPPKHPPRNDLSR